MKQVLIILLFLFTLNCKDETKIEPLDSNSVKVTEVSVDSTKIEPKIEIDFILGKFDYRTHPDFVRVERKYSFKELFIQKEVYDAFLQMHAAAKKDGITLSILSGTRNFDEQKAIWERKWKRFTNETPKERIKKIMEYSSMPSTSRHHWGTDIDLNNLTNSYFTYGKGKKIYDWLVDNANNYGFYQVYTEKDNGRTGYNLERWHWSYMPLAQHYLEYYNTTISYRDISGFNGTEYAEDLEIIPNYVNGISEKLKN